jgi:1-acyl-sn-glycerol-3-phosphate acyltransferase
MVQRSLTNHLGYSCLRAFCRIIAVTVFRIRVQGRHLIPAGGPVLVCANHQSYFDPVIVGLTFNRRMNYLARKSLFRFYPFRWLIEALGAIPIDREGVGLSGMKECLRRIKDGEVVLIFPEGTRTRDGEVSALHPGFVMLARRGGVTLLPVGIDGAFDAWPRDSAMPRGSTIAVCVGEPMPASEVQQLDDLQLIAAVEERIRQCFERARKARHVYGPMGRIEHRRLMGS